MSFFKNLIVKMIWGDDEECFGRLIKYPYHEQPTTMFMKCKVNIKRDDEEKVDYIHIMNELIDPDVEKEIKFEVEEPARFSKVKDDEDCEGICWEVEDKFFRKTTYIFVSDEKNVSIFAKLICNRLYFQKHKKKPEGNIENYFDELLGTRSFKYDLDTLTLKKSISEFSSESYNSPIEHLLTLRVDLFAITEYTAAVMIQQKDATATILTKAHKIVVKYGKNTIVNYEVTEKTKLNFNRGEIMFGDEKNGSWIIKFKSSKEEENFFKEELKKMVEIFKLTIEFSNLSITSEMK